MMLDAVPHFFTAGDHMVMRRLHRWRAPRWIRLWMICATRSGDGWLWYAMGALILLFGGPSRYTALSAAASATATGIVLFLLLKRCARRKRPCAIERHCWATLVPPDQFSFPSGHSITAFAAAISLGLFYPSLLPGLSFCACNIAISRIVLGMHFVSDVVAGSAIGAILGYAAVALFR